MTYVVLIEAAGALLGGIILLALWKSTEVKLIAAQAELAKAQAADAADEKGTEVSEESRADEKARLEAVITGLKAEIAKLEGEMDATTDPAVVRARLRGLLAAPSEPVPAANPASGGVPPYGGVPR